MILHQSSFQLYDSVPQKPITITPTASLQEATFVFLVDYFIFCRAMEAVTSPAASMQPASPGYQKQVTFLSDFGKVGIDVSDSTRSSAPSGGQLLVRLQPFPPIIPKSSKNTRLKSRYLVISEQSLSLRICFQN